MAEMTETAAAERIARAWAAREAAAAVLSSEEDNLAEAERLGWPLPLGQSVTVPVPGDLDTGTLLTIRRTGTGRRPEFNYSLSRKAQD